MVDWRQLEEALGERLGEPLAITRHTPLGGGCINRAWRLESSRGEFFAKANQTDSLAIFEAEAAALDELHRDGSLRVPRPLATLEADGQAWLLLEYLPLGGRLDAAVQRALGSGLARLHATPRPWFGWWRDNAIGATPQPNRRSDDWPAFWAEERLGFQLERAARQGIGSRVVADGEALAARLRGLFDGYAPYPSLLHGDLWGGNVAATGDGEAVIFDPASYYGDREADLAMTELFGGFGSDFHAAYREALPLDAGYPQRKTLYNLYHVLNHYNLFGGGYGRQAAAMIGQLLAECR